MALAVSLLATSFAAAAAQGPPHSHPSRSINGWSCDGGHRESKGQCLPVDVPANAYGTRLNYARGWICQRGFRKVDHVRCEPVSIPDHAYLDAAGDGWECERGYLVAGGACAPVATPANGFLSEDGAGWICARGYRAAGPDCVAIVAPVNGYLSNVDHGSGWACERGFRVRGETCEAVATPDHAYFVDSQYGDPWRCLRGYGPRDGACVPLILPPNAHLDRSGNDWDCDPQFRRRGAECAPSDR